MKKPAKLHKCTVKGCGQKYAADTGGTTGEKGRCPAHYKKLERFQKGESTADPDGPLRGSGGGLVSVKFFITKQGREALAKRANAAGVSLSSYVAGLVPVD